MFDLLKKKLTGFIDSLTKKEAAKPSEPPAEPTPPQPAQAPQHPGRVEPVSEARAEPQPPASEAERAQPAGPLASARETAEDAMLREAESLVARGEREKPVPEPRPEAKPAPAPRPLAAVKPEPTPAREPTAPAPARRVPGPAHAASEPRREPPSVQPPSKPAPTPAPAPGEPSRELKPKLGLLQRITSAFTGRVTIQDGDVAPLFDELHLLLLESDVSYDTAQFLVDDLRKRLVGKQVAKSELHAAVKADVRAALVDLFQPAQPIRLEDVIARKKGTGEPAVILFLGTNGSGKTTTIAKLARQFKDQGLGVVLAAADSFRAGAVQQLSEHGDKLGVKVVKRDYGADPTAIAFDAVAHAKANKLDVVLVDTAGRQETNYNLVREMEKMNRVLKPDARVLVGEAVAGHAIIEQVQKFKEAVGGLDGVILTKLDADAKGGTALSLARETGVPLLYLGIGQGYNDLKPFNAKWLAESLVA